MLVALMLLVEHSQSGGTLHIAQRLSRIPTILPTLAITVSNNLTITCSNDTRLQKIEKNLISSES